MTTFAALFRICLEAAEEKEKLEPGTLTPGDTETEPTTK